MRFAPLNVPNVVPPVSTCDQTYYFDGSHVVAVIPQGSSYITIEKHYGLTARWISIKKHSSFSHIIESQSPTESDVYHGYSTNSSNVLFMSAHDTDNLNGYLYRIDMASASVTHTYVTGLGNIDVGHTACTSSHVYVCLPYSAVIKKLLNTDLSVVSTISTAISRDKMLSDGDHIYFALGYGIAKIDGVTDVVTTLISGNGVDNYDLHFMYSGYMYASKGNGDTWAFVKIEMSSGTETVLGSERETSEYVTYPVSGKVILSGKVYTIATNAFFSVYVEHR